MKAIPTMYKGIQFRSRLEAKWAAFFDNVKWKWSYEPYDLNGWIPDFAILGADKILVEVKPVFEFPEDISTEIDRAFPPNKEIPDRFSGDSREALILGAELISGNLGWLREGTDWQPTMWTQGVSGLYGFCHSTQSYHCRITGDYDGDHYVCGLEEPILEAWCKAANTVQWKSPRM